MTITMELVYVVFFVRSGDIMPVLYVHILTSHKSYSYAHDTHLVVLKFAAIRKKVKFH